MPTFSIRLENDDKVRIGLNRWAQAITRITKDDLRETMRLAKKRSVSDPAGGAYSVPERGYVRTGVLSASTYLQENGLSVSIVSNAVSKEGRAYSTYVVGNADGYGQAQIHRDFWTPLRTSVDDGVELLVGKLDDDYGEAARKEGL